MANESSTEAIQCKHWFYLIIFSVLQFLADRNRESCSWLINFSLPSSVCTSWIIATQGNSPSAGSTSGSSSGQNTMLQAELASPLGTRAGHQQEALMVTVDDYNYGQGFGATAGTAPIFQQHTAGQDKVIATQWYHLLSCSWIMITADLGTISLLTETRAYVL